MKILFPLACIVFGSTFVVVKKWSEFGELKKYLVTEFLTATSHKRRSNQNGNSSEFIAARKILSTSCMRCHGNFGVMSEQEWAASKYVVPGNPSSSLLIRKLKGAGGNMPPEGFLSGKDEEVLRNWISSADSIESFAGGGVNGATPMERFASAKAIFRNKCAACHSVSVNADSSYRNGWSVPGFALFETENDFVVSGLVTPQKHKRSWIYLALRVWNTHSKSLKSPISLGVEDEKLLAIWIDEMGEP